jgi:hypothetical protein
MRERVQPTIVVFGTPGSDPILGVVTLEEFRLAADPVNRRLISVPGRLKGSVLGSPTSFPLSTNVERGPGVRTKVERATGGED